MTKQQDMKVQRGAPETGDADDRERGFEPKDAPMRPIVIALLSFAMLMLIGLAFPALLLRLAPPVARTAPFQPPAPRLLADPRGERLRLEARQKGAVRSLDRAMEQVARRGWDDDKGVRR
jgi:hypothetical protein